MKRIKLLVLQLVLLSFIFLSPNVNAAQRDSLINRVKSLSAVKEVRPLLSGPYTEKYELKFEQPVDYSDTIGAKFLQRVYVMHEGYNAPVVFVTEGYGAGNIENPSYREELSRILGANIIFVEHRYFLESTPSGRNWKYLNARNEANDLHRIREAFASIYKGKWIATGISKGGQNAIIYTAFYPADVNITVAYVAPLCRSLEDGRHEPFIADRVGTTEVRNKVLDFQKLLLRKRGTLMPLFDSLCTANNLKFGAGLNEIYDYTVLEYSFSFWQWGYDPKGIPTSAASDRDIFRYWMRVSSPNYFAVGGPTEPFYVQAAKELGYYGYDIKPFKGLLTIKKSKGYLKKLLLPEGYSTGFDKSLYNMQKRFIKNTTNHIMFIYGGIDPWSSVGFMNEQTSGSVVVFVEPQGSHRTRIYSLPEPMKSEARDTLNRWLSE